MASTNGKYFENREMDRYGVLAPDARLPENPAGDFKPQRDRPFAERIERAQEGKSQRFGDLEFSSTRGSGAGEMVAVRSAVPGTIRVGGAKSWRRRQPGRTKPLLRCGPWNGCWTKWRCVMSERHWLQFGLKALLLTMLVVGAFLAGWKACEMEYREDAEMWRAVIRGYTQEP